MSVAGRTWVKNKSMENQEAKVDLQTSKDSPEKQNQQFLHKQPIYCLYMNMYIYLYIIIYTHTYIQVLIIRI